MKSSSSESQNLNDGVPLLAAFQQRQYASEGLRDAVARLVFVGQPAEELHGALGDDVWLLFGRQQGAKS